MVYLKEKEISGSKYCYLTKSIRLPDGKVKTLQKLIKGRHKGIKALEAEYAEFFAKKEKEAFAKFAVGKYQTGSIFSAEEIGKIEGIKVDYQHTVKGFSREQKKDAFDRFIANFTYESNAIEGNSLTLKDVAIVMFENRVVEGRDLREIYETRNSRKVMDIMLKNRFDITEKDIIRIHRMLMEDIDTRTGYKAVPNYIVGGDVKLTPPEKVKGEMGNLLEWYGKEIEKIHPLQLSALFHGKFERIHPFEDGNGRVGRFLSNVILLRNGYAPLIIRKSQRDSYIKCLEDFHRGYTANLERLFLDKYKKTYRNLFAVYRKYIK
ncbi:MAG: Fic family protein [Candidatus Diapherotrites archaeon]